ncbi:NUDIX domain-containing protein [Actinophytocola glycyrrhizae]|uniref:NUDIX domain-containing protein n=1 Tax=Actinophytocola glycyrrhizae TaxID=2044873 RepID=A0ABV9SBH5_9PSEU
MRKSRHEQGRAFSCYVFTSDARLLLTMRGQAKKAWPGVWSDSCHGTPGVGESTADAVVRALRDELGFTTAVAELVLPDFHCLTTGELCHVYRVVTDEPPRPDPVEVGDFEWVDWADFVYAVSAGDLTVAPWCAPQVAALSSLGTDPVRWPPNGIASAA